MEIDLNTVTFITETDIIYATNVTTDQFDECWLCIRKRLDGYTGW